MKKSNIILLLVLFIGIVCHGCSLKNNSDKNPVVTHSADNTVQIISASQLRTPQDTQQLPMQRIEEGKKYLRNNWMNLIHVKKGSYKTGKNNTGISKLTIEAENTTAYAIDSIKVLVTFFAKGDCIKADYVELKNIPSEGKSVVKVPDSKEATSFQVQVRKVNSSGMQLCFDIDDPNREGDDPYKCK